MSWVYRPSHPEANENGMVEKHLIADEPKASSRLPRPYVISDSLGEPVKHLATGVYSDSKSFHNRKNKELGLLALGNEQKAHLSQPKPAKLDKRQRRNDIGKAVQQLKNGRRV